MDYLLINQWRPNHITQPIATTITTINYFTATNYHLVNQYYHRNSRSPLSHHVSSCRGIRLSECFTDGVISYVGKSYFNEEN